MVIAEEFRELKQKLAQYEEQQKQIMEGMRAEVEKQVSGVAEGLRDLYAKADAALIKTGRRIDELESEVKKTTQPKSLLQPKHMVINKLEKSRRVEKVESRCGGLR